MTQNASALKHPRVPDPIRAAKARRGTLSSQSANERRLEAPAPRPAWKDREPMAGLPGTLAMRRRAAREAVKFAALNRTLGILRALPPIPPMRRQLEVDRLAETAAVR